MPLTHYSDFDLVDFEDPDFPFDDPDFFDEKDESASPNTYEDDFRLVFRHYVDRDLLEAFEYISYYFEGDQLGDFLRSQKRFNQTAHLGSLRRTIGVLPEYFEAATRSDIGIANAHRLLVYASEQLNGLGGGDRPSTYTILLTRFLRMCSKKGVALVEAGEELQGFIELTAKTGVAATCIYALTICIEMGMQLKNAITLVSKIPTIEGGGAGYVVGAFNDAIKTLRIARVDGSLLIETFDAIGGDDPRKNLWKYQFFEEVLWRGCPRFLVSPEDMVRRLCEYFQGGSITALPQVDGEDDDSALTHDPREYFMERAEPLTPESLPYVTKKSFEDGLAELHTCCMNREGRFEEVAEGLWAFDPATKSWYSLGGKSERTSEGMTHDFMNYDVSLLSSTPIIIHIHPLDVEPHMRAQPGDDAPDAFFDKLGKYFSAILSRKDCSVLHKFSFDTRNEMSLSAGIVCSVGYLSITLPNDLRTLNTLYEQIKDSTVAVAYHMESQWKELQLDVVGEFEFVQTGITLLNKELPEGVIMELHEIEPRPF